VMKRKVRGLEFLRYLYADILKTVMISRAWENI
jgi:hypothetical protein